jgi:hypothetical protein
MSDLATIFLLVTIVVFFVSGVAILAAQLAEDLDVRPMTEAEFDIFLRRLRPPEC